MLESVTIACSHCGTLQNLGPLPPRSAAVCPTCDRKLERTSGRSVGAALACSLATLLLLFPANLLPLMSVSMLGMTRRSRISSGVSSLWEAHWVIVAVVVMACVVVLPIVRFGLLSAVLAHVRVGRRPAWLGPAFRWAFRLDRWAMPDVFLIGCAIGYSRVAANLPVTIQWGGICLIAAAFLCMLSRASLDRRTVWRAIAAEHPLPPPGSRVISCTTCDLVLAAGAEQARCPRCRARLQARKPNASVRTLALVVAGFLLYFPANLYPMSTNEQIGRFESHRIIDGIVELYRAGLWPLGILIFCTSIAIPMLKICGLGWLLLSVRRRSTRRLVLKTKLYRLIDEIGRWSNVDVFTIAVFVPLMQFPGLVSAHAASGAPAFVSVVVLTMIAARAFDPRLLWDEGWGAST